METFLGVPILVGGQAWGNLYLTEKEGGEFTDDDEQAVVMLARYAAIAIDNARRLEQLSGRRDELERSLAAMRATNEISRALAGETDLGIVLELIAKRGRALVGASALLIELVVGDGLAVAAVAGDVDRAIVGSEIDMAGTVAGRVLETRRAAAAQRRAQPRALQRDGPGPPGPRRPAPGSSSRSCSGPRRPACWPRSIRRVEPTSATRTSGC